MLNIFTKIFMVLRPSNEKMKLKQITQIIYFLGLHLGLFNCY